MKLYPLHKCAAALDHIFKTGGMELPQVQVVRGTDYRIDFFQQFSCSGCGTKQTMDDPNVLYTSGKCEECDHITDIKKDGCNYMLHIQAKHQGTDAE